MEMETYGSQGASEGVCCTKEKRIDNKVVFKNRLVAGSVGDEFLLSLSQSSKLSDSAETL